ncbi:MAG: SDR family oxidoreductase [Pyrinomonadaceae bacterium]
MSSPTESKRPRVLILGGVGMLGHKLYQILQESCEVWATVRGRARDYQRFGIFDETRLLSGVDVQNFDTVVRAFASVRPNVVINAVGVIKQLPTAKDPIVSLTINSILPHRLAGLCGAAGAQFITLSTDCIFNGSKGNYSEDDLPDAEDLYGRSKYLGEVAGEGCLTLRTSIVGRELDSAHSMVEWFLSNKGGKVRGFRQAIYSGLPTITMARLIGELIANHPDLSGVYHVSSDPINKYDLLMLIRDAYKVDIKIEPDDEFVLDRSLDSTRFRKATGLVPPAWPALVNEMASDPTRY